MLMVTQCCGRTCIFSLLALLAASGENLIRKGFRQIYLDAMTPELTAATIKKEEERRAEAAAKAAAEKAARVAAAVRAAALKAVEAARAAATAAGACAAAIDAAVAAASADAAAEAASVAPAPAPEPSAAAVVDDPELDGMVAAMAAHEASYHSAQEPRLQKRQLLPAKRASRKAAALAAKSRFAAPGDSDDDDSQAAHSSGAAKRCAVAASRGRGAGAGSARAAKRPRREAEAASEDDASASEELAEDDEAEAGAGAGAGAGAAAVRRSTRPSKAGARIAALAADDALDAEVDEIVQDFGGAVSGDESGADEDDKGADAESASVGTGAGAGAGGPASSSAGSSESSTGGAAAGGRGRGRSVREVRLVVYQEEQVLPYLWEQYQEMCLEKGPTHSFATRRLTKVQGSLEDLLQACEEHGDNAALAAWQAVRDEINAALEEGAEATSKYKLVVPSYRRGGPGA
jgi:hypothetical protein